MNYAYVWWVIGGAQLLFLASLGTLIVLERSRRIGWSVDLFNSAERDQIRQWGRSLFWWRRMQAARCLSEIATSADREMISRLLRDPHPGVQSTATAALLRYADEGLIASVVDSLASRSRAVQVYQSKVLRHHSVLSAPLVLLRLRDDVSPAKLYSYIFLAQTLGVPECIERVAALSIHENAEIRVAVARALNTAPRESATIKLLTMLRDPDWRVRAQAARGLGAIPEDRVISELARALTDTTWWVRFRAGLALASLGDPGHKALVTALSGEDRYARDMASFVHVLSPSSIAELSEG